MRAGSSGRLTIGMLTRSLSEIHQTQWLGALDACRALDVNLVTFVGSDLENPLDFDAAANRVYDLVSGRRIDGLLVWSLSLEVYVGPERFASYLRRFERLPVTLIEQGFPGYTSVMMDDQGGMAVAVDHLIEVHGHRRIAFIRGPSTHAGSGRRFRGYADSLERHGIPLDLSLVTEPTTIWSRIEAADYAAELLNRAGKLDAIVAASDGLAIGALNALNERGMQPPEDVALVGFDDDPSVLQYDVSLKEPRSVELDEAVRLAATMLPLATVRAPFYRLGQRAAELTVARLRGEPVPELECLPTQFVPRLSCGCVAPEEGPTRSPADRGWFEAPAVTTSACPSTESESGADEREDSREGQDCLAPEDAGATVDDECLASLTAALLADVANGGDDFERMLVELVRASARTGQSFDPWWERLFAIQSLVVDRKLRPEESKRAARRLWRGRRLLLEMVERFRRYGSLVDERRNQIVRGIGHRLVTRFDLADLADAVTEELPWLGIDTAFLASYDGEGEGQLLPSALAAAETSGPGETAAAAEGAADTPSAETLAGADDDPFLDAELVPGADGDQPGFARSLLVLREGSRHPQDEGIRFPSRLLVPGPLDSANRAANLVVFPLRFGKEALGYAVFGVGPRLGWMYAALVQQLESALYDALLVSRLKAEIARRERAEIALTAANDELEERVALRTAELERANAALLYEIVERARAEEHRANLEGQLHVAQKMEALGRLAGGIAHDFNNLLVAISGFGQMVLDSLDPDDPRRQEMEQIRIAGDRAAGLTRQLLAFGRRQPHQPSVLDLNEVVAGIEPMLRRVIGEDVLIEAVPDEGLWQVSADRGQVEQVIVNLALNARDAMPSGGRLTIETGNARMAEGQTPALPGEYGMLSISDTGTGMDETVRAHLFEPFFTTKAPGAGTGLGLATVFGIVQQNEGYIEVSSEPEAGSTFRVYFPRAETPLSEDAGTAPALAEPAEPAEPHELAAQSPSQPATQAVGRSAKHPGVEPATRSTVPPTPRTPSARPSTRPGADARQGGEARHGTEAHRSPLGGSETVLLVEDEPAVRAVTERFLRNRGYRVHAVPGPKEALEFLRDFQDPLDLLLTDVVMPGMNGRQLVELARQQRPSLPVLFVTGYDDGALVRQGFTGAEAEVLEKPFSPDSLWRAVRRVLDTAKAASPTGS